MTTEIMERRVDAAKEKMKKVLEYMRDHPETGYREWNASRLLAEEYRALGYTLREAGDIPGFYTDIDTGRPGPRVLILGELDALLVPGHPNEDPVTHAAHACGHNAQSAALLGVATALADPASLEGLSGSIRLCAVPAEELVELDFRDDLRRKGIISYYGGKQEFLRRGYFDGCDLAFMIHTGGGTHKFSINAGMNGSVIKTAEFIGKATHAAAPSAGINALDAATLSINAINALRTTFRNVDFCRVHPILTEAGYAVNSVPGRVVMENQVRGATPEIVRALNTRVNRAVAASAASMGAHVRLCDRPGYLPAAYDRELCETALEAFREIVGEDHVRYNRDLMQWETGCSDMNDLSNVMPALHCYGSGAVGAGHSVAHRIADFECACTESAKAQLRLLSKLLSNGAERARHIVENFQPHFADKAQYFAFLDSLFFDREAVTYNEDGSVLLTVC